MPPGQRRYLGTNAAAAALSIDRSTLWRWWRRGYIRPAMITPSGRPRWDLDDLRRQLSISRPEVWVPGPATQPERPPVVAAVVTSHRGLLAGRRRDGKPPWTLIAGEIEPGESQADAAIREVKEEACLEVTTGHREITRRVHPVTGRTMIYLACTPVGTTDVAVGDPDELAEVRWLTLAEVDELMPDLYPPVREHLERMIT